MTNASIPTYLEFIDVIAAGTTPQAVADYRPTPKAQQRLAELIARERAGSLSEDEKSEIDHFMGLASVK